MIDRRERGTGGEGRLRETEENVEVGRGEGRGGGWGGGECQGWPRREREDGLKDWSVGRRRINRNSRKQEGEDRRGEGRGRIIKRGRLGSREGGRQAER